MSVALRRPMTFEEFLDWENRQELKHEFDGIAPQAMTGGTVKHATIQANLAIEFGSRLRGMPHQFLGSVLKIRTSEGHVRYPDGMVIRPPYPPQTATWTDSPVIVFEVLSPSTARNDRITKNREYAAMPSVRRLVLLEQDEIAATIFSRETGDWLGRLVQGPDAGLRPPEIDLEFPLALLYQGVRPADPADTETRS